MNADSVVYAVVMAGGSGTRFWPMSRGTRPKQLIDILGGPTMIQATVARLQPLVPPERILVVTTIALAEETRRQLPMLKADQIIAEPMGRDTAACVALAAVVVERLSPGATMILLPADQVIDPIADFQAALRAGVALAEQGRLVVYGIAPRFPATGYGYMRLAEGLPPVEGVAVHRVERFVEKPDRQRAEQYLAEGCYRWNSGIFTWRSDVVLRELDTHCGWLTEAVRPLGAAWGTPGFANAFAEVYAPLKKVSIDYALMEHAQSIVAVTGAFTWDDLGSWDALYDHLDADADGVISQGDVLALDCRDSLVLNRGPQTVVTVGIQGLSVVVTSDAILVLPKGRSQEVKRAVDALKASGRGPLL